LKECTKGEQQCAPILVVSISGKQLNAGRNENSVKW